MSMLAEIRCSLVLAVPNQNNRITDLHLCCLVGSHKLKPKSQYNPSVYSKTGKVFSSEFI